MTCRVLLADDHGIVRGGIAALLEREGFQVLGEASDGWEATQKARELHPDVVVLDILMPNLNGLDAAREILRHAPDTKVLLLTQCSEQAHVLEALLVGVRGYVLKSQAVSDLPAALRDVQRGGTYLSPRISHLLVDAYRLGSAAGTDPLTARERQVLQLIAEGRTNKEVAQILDVSQKTVETHRARLMEKLEVHGTAELVRYAIRRGLIQA
jgi:DNA-binding NarL/FixJ family response regulator